MTGHKRLLVFVSSFLFLFILLRTENNNKYNRMALFAGRRTTRIMNYQTFSLFSLWRSIVVPTMFKIKTTVTKMPNS